MRKLIAIIGFVLAIADSNLLLAAEDVLQLNEKDIADAIKQEFVERGMAENKDIDLEFFGGQTDFQIEKAKEVKVLINNLKADEDAGRFSCEAQIFADRKPYVTTELVGKFFLLTEVWVPVANVAKGETITDDILQEKLIRKSKLKPFMVTEKDKLLGLEAKKFLKEGKIINDNDVGAKILIKRDDIVMAVYRTDKMQITAKVVAQQDGAYGDRIEVLNMKTRKPLSGVVKDKATVVVEQ